MRSALYQDNSNIRVVDIWVKLECAANHLRQLASRFHAGKSTAGNREGQQSPFDIGVFRDIGMFQTLKNMVAQLVRIREIAHANTMLQKAGG